MLRMRAQLASAKLRNWPSPSSGTPSTPMRTASSPMARTTAACQPSMSRGTWVAESAPRQLASSAGSKLAGSICATGPR